MQKHNWKFKSSVFLLAVSLALSGVTVVSAESNQGNKHEKINLTDVTGEIVAPPLLTSAASAVAKEKAWYEYVYYSDRPVAYYYLNDSTRISFYDPYDYSEALIMEVDDTLTDWSSNNSMTVSYSTGNTITDTSEKSTNVVSTVNYGYADTTTTTTGPNTVETSVKNKTETYNTVTENKTVIDDNTNTHTVSGEAGLEIKIVNIGGGYSNTWKTGTVENKTTVTGDISGEYGGTRTGYTVSDNKTTVSTGSQTTTVVNTIADRTSRATGYTTNSEISLSTNNSTTVTKTYDAGYFNDKGTPLQWKIIKYTVKMPMFYQVEYLVDGEWIYGDSNYCTINTIQGTCRAYMSNNVAYYEHWGTGEPVVWEKFWGQFFTESSLIASYKNRLYPER